MDANVVSVIIVGFLIGIMFIFIAVVPEQGLFTVPEEWPFPVD